MNETQNMAQLPLAVTALRQLAPSHLPTYRQFRFDGGALRVPFEDFAETDQTLLRTVYSRLVELLALLKEHWHNADATLHAVQAYLSESGWVQVVRQMQKFGNASLATAHHPQLNRVIHDIRGSSFTALSIFLQLIEMGLSDETDISRLFYLTRDHLKIMRNAVQGLDLAGEARDALENHHDISLIVEKWQGVIHHVQDRLATIHVECHYAGSISESCLEFAALDRVLYNLINNAVRFTADQQVYLAIFPLDANERVLRFVVYNRTTAAHLAELQQHYEDNLGQLFLGGFTTGGTGLGLRICAEFVTNAFGLPSVEHGLHHSYFGVTQIDDYFVNWVHWPTAGD